MSVFVRRLTARINDILSTLGLNIRFAGPIDLSLSGYISENDISVSNLYGNIDPRKRIRRSSAIIIVIMPLLTRVMYHYPLAARSSEGKLSLCLNCRER